MSIRRSLLPLTALLLIAACRSPVPPPEPPPLESPDWAMDLQRHPGSPLSGPRLEDEAWVLTPTAHVRLRWFLVRPPMPRDWDPLPSRARVIAEQMGDTPWRTGSLRAASLRVAAGDRAREFLRDLEEEPDRFLVVEDLLLDLMPDTTVVLEAMRTEVVAAPGDFLNELAVRGPVERDFAVHLHQPRVDAPVEMALSWTDTDSLRRIRKTPTSRALVPADPTELRQELFLLKDLLATDGGPVVVLGPVPFQEPTGTLLAIVAEPLPLPEHTAERQQTLREEFDTSQQQLREDLGPSGHQEVVSLRRSSAWEALRSNSERRSALVFLAGDLESALAGDVALSADDTFLEAFTTRLQNQGNLDGDPGWTLERHAWKELATALVTDEDNLALQGMALRHAGQVGRFPDVLRGILALSVDQADFQQRLLLENRSFLEDADPGARVRAHDWLVRQGAAVEGYDPLADAPSRRAVLEGDS